MHFPAFLHFAGVGQPLHGVIIVPHHLTLSAQYAADILPLLMFLA